MKKLKLIMLAGILSCFGCDKEEITPENSTKGILIQVSVIDALLQGIYDGICPTGDLLTWGNFGTGTFHALNGEMMILNDTVFQILSSGEIVNPSADVTTPFAGVTEFYADTVFTINDLSYDSIKAGFNNYFPTPNLFYAVKMQGEFIYMKTRSVPVQTKPYPPLVEVTKNQPEFEFSSVKGDIVGFYCPAYTQGISITGFHLHFLTSDRTGGGHITNFQVKHATLEIGYLSDCRLILPTSGDFFGGDFTIDRSDELEEAEK